MSGKTHLDAVGIPLNSEIGKASTEMVPYTKPVPTKSKPESFLELIQPRPSPQTPFQLELERTKTQILFSKYPDGTLRLYKPDSIIGDTPADYNEQKVSVKIRVTTPTEDFMVAIQTTREQLDKPGTEEVLAQTAYGWARMR